MNIGGLAIIFGFASSAAFATADKGESSLKLLCEHRLASGSAHSAKLQLKRPIHVNVRDMVTDLTLDKLHFNRKIFREKETPLFIMQIERERPVFPVEIQVLTFEDGKRRTVAEIDLPDANPVLWRRLVVNEQQARFQYLQLIEEFPARSEDFALGYVSDLDPDGVRIFLARDNQGPFSLGLDVPCMDLDQYLAAPAFIRHVRTPSGDFCRVMILGS